MKYFDEIEVLILEAKSTGTSISSIIANNTM